MYNDDEIIDIYEKKVNYEDLSPEEKLQADDQIKRIEIEEKANNDVIAFAQTPYVFTGEDFIIFDSVNTNNSFPVPTEGSLINVAQAAYAFDESKIELIKKRIEEKLSEYVDELKKTVNDPNLIEIYKTTWIKTINDVLEQSKIAGIQLNKESKEAYQIALDEVNRINKSI